jgi:hypothetical protein
VGVCERDGTKLNAKKVNFLLTFLSAKIVYDFFAQLTSHLRVQLSGKQCTSRERTRVNLYTYNRAGRQFAIMLLFAHVTWLDQFAGC